MKPYYFAVALLCTPLIIWTGLPYGQAFPRVLAITVLAVSGFWLLLIQQKKLPAFTNIDWSFFALLGAFSIATLTSTAPMLSIFGTMERGTGIGFWLILFCTFLLFKSVWLEKTGAVLWRTLGVIQVLVSVWAVCERLIPGLATSFSGARVGGPFGNAVFLSMYLTLALCALCIGYIQYPLLYGTRTKAIYAAIGSLSFIALLFSATRGPLVALTVGAVVAAAIFFWKSSASTKHTRIIFGALLLLGILTTGFLYIRGTTSLSTRSINWSMAWQGFLDKPITGWGPETYRFIVDAHFNPALSTYGFQETYADKPHNAQLELLGTTGLVGGIAYIAVLVSVLCGVISLYRSKQVSLLTVSALTLFFIEHEVQNASAFETPATLILFALVLAWVSAQTQKNRAPSQISTITSIVIALCATLYTAQLLRFVPQALRIQRIEPTAESFTTIITHQPSFFEFETWQSLSDILRANPHNTALETIFAEFTGTLYQKHNNETWWLYALAVHETSLFDATKNSAYANSALELLQRATKVSPLRAQSFIEMSQLHLKLGNIDAAFSEISQAVAINDSLVLARFYRGLIEVIQKNYADAWVDIKFALDYKYRLPSQAYVQALRKEFSNANMPEAAAYLESSAAYN